MTETSVKYQYLAAAVVNLLSISNGIAYGWTSPSFVLLKSDKTPLPSGKIDTEETSWIASFLCVGGLIGNLFFGFLTNKCGRKIPLIAIAIPKAIGWILILVAEDVYYLYAARILAGFVGGGILIIVPLYLSEIANDKVRGALVSTFVLTWRFGTLLAYILGEYSHYYTTPIITIALVTVFAFSLCFFPESPTFLVKQNRISEAEKSINFYRCLDGNKESIELEVNRLKDKVCSNEKFENLKWSDFTPKTSQKAITIGIALVALNQFSGCFAMMNYTVDIFEESGSNVSANMSAIIVGAVQLIGVFIATNLVDRTGRKLLLAVSSIGIALGFICFGTYSLLEANGVDVRPFNWIPITSFSFIIFVASLGVLTIPFLVISELMPEKLKNFGTSFCMELLWLLTFIMLKCLPSLLELLGKHGSMFLFAAVCLCSTVFIVIVIPETKGKSYDEIMKSLDT